MENDDRQFWVDTATGNWFWQTDAPAATRVLSGDGSVTVYSEGA